MKLLKISIIFLLFSTIITSCLNSNDTSFAESAGDSAAIGHNGVGGSLARFTVTKDHLYTIDNSTLKVFNLTDPDNPILVKTIHVGWGIETIFPLEDFLFFGAQDGMFIYSISNPSSPTLISRYEHVQSCDPVVANMERAYVTLRNNNANCGGSVNELQVVNIEDKANPYLTMAHSMIAPKGLSLRNNCLFVCDQDGLKVFDVTDKDDPKLQATHSIEADDVIALDDRLMVIGKDGLYQYSYGGEKCKEATLLSKIDIIPIN